MSKVLLFALLAAFAMMFAFVAEAPLIPDAVVQPALDAGPVLTLTMEYVAVAEMPLREAEHPNMNYIPRGADTGLDCTMNEATAVERGGRDCIRSGGFARLL